ncbi:MULTISPECIES: response regulator transcription factor [Fulvivirga]|jgi:DNA-binding NarL/FixJ family response regulator|uniref:response regulator transcription factor n=1 Tax=Fulvivirga TaxID=396811 RepID=UPI0012BCCAAE|nr:response regulator transcription factor [Fulvivirga lutimaris]MTI40646.1 response regulator transcription factor [Fulvivirga lutimaris]
MNYFKSRIVIVEDNDAVREGFSLIINSVSNYLVVNAYDNAEDAIKNVRKDKPDVILMDLELPGMNGIEAIGIIKKASPHIDLIVNTIYENSDLVFQALVAGASGYITKNTSHTELLDAIEEVINGGAPMSSKIAKMVVASFQKNPNSPLSKRETEVLELLSKGKSYSMIAQELFVTKETAKSHIKNIYSKLQVNSKSEAIAKATKEKLI